MSNLEKKIIIHALIQLLGEEILTVSQRWDLLEHVILVLCGENVRDIIAANGDLRHLLIKRGTQAENDEYTGQLGEITMDETNNSLRIHDGTTAGGHQVSGGADGEFADTDLSNITDSGRNVIANARRLDFENRIDYTAANQITVPADGYIFCRGATRSMDWMSEDFQNTIMAEFILSSGYATVWAPVFAGQCLKNRNTSQYQQVYFVPYISMN